jgi:hypothetical protein
MPEPVFPPRPPGRRAILLVAGLTLVLAACGGGGGGGGGGGNGSGAEIHVLVVNAADADKTVTYTDANGTATDKPVPTCTATVLLFPVSDPFQVAVDGTTVIDSAQLPNGMPGDGQQDLIVKVDVAKDGTTKFDSVRVGRDISVPARTAYCATLPG